MTARAFAWATVSFLSCWLQSSFVRADGMQCGRRLVVEGDSLHHVRSVCGAPDDAQHRVEPRTVHHRVWRACGKGRHKTRCERIVARTVQVSVDLWTYDFGRHQFLRHLTFEQGKLVRITLGSYGQKDPR